MKVYPKISIVTPNYNLGDYLEQTILSVINQGYPNLEYIIIDGGSTDQSVEIIKKYEKHLAYWVSEPDRGMYDAINKGFKQSSGEIMAWINSDDLYHTGCFFTVARLFSSIKEVEWVMGRASYFDESGYICYTPDYFVKWSKYKYYLFEYDWIQQESVFWKRSLWTKAGEYLSTDLTYAGDLELWIRFFRYAHLYTSNVLLGGFRARTSNQKSFDSLDEYHKEAQECVKQEVFSLSSSEKKRIIWLKLFNKMVMKIPVIKSSGFTLSLRDKLYGFPDRIYFNARRNAFKLGRFDVLKLSKYTKS